ncbi:MAG: Hpt domain-containing protein, partial [Nitrosomonadales bacterium]|nr:Hpt domain-containing protein [Nitrosomonadales bacterium]
TEKLIRSAHTLASNAGATGFKSISDLSRALENWLDVFAEAWDPKSITLLGNVVESLSKMMDKVEALLEPKRASGLLTALKKATEKASLSVQPADKSLEESKEVVAREEAVLADSDQPDVTESIVVTSPLDQELVSIFTEEARDLVPQVGNELRAWRKAPEVHDHPDALQRALHTLKGSARMAGQTEMGDVVHHLEDRIIQALKRKVTPVDFDDMFQDVDKIGAFLEELTGDATVGRAAASTQGRASNRRAQFLRLRADVLDRLINEAGEISIARSRMEREMLAFKHFSLDLTESVFRLRNYLRELEIETESQMQSRMTLLQETQEAFDPLEFDRFTRLQELTRMMAESV